MLAVSIATVALGACDAPGFALDPLLTQQSWTDERAPSGFKELAELQPPCRDCLTFERVAILGDESGPGLLPYDAQSVVVDRHGNYWAGQVETIKVFDPHGTFLRDVGRAGQGPLEFQDAWPVFSDVDGNVHIFDFMNARETIVGSDFALVDMRPMLQRAPPDQLSPLLGGRYVTAMWVPTPDRIAFPLHVIEGTEIIRSFGIPADAEQNPQTRHTAQRLVTTDAGGHIFSAEKYRYLIEVWMVDGNRIMGLQGPRLNDAEVSPDPWSMEGNPPPMGWIFDIRVDDRERLWVLSWQRKENWHDVAVERIRPNGNIVLTTEDGAKGFFRSRIDVIDLNTATLIASETVDEFLVQLLDGQRVLESDPTEEGDWQLAVWEVDLNERTKGGK